MSAFDTRDITQSAEYQQELGIQKTFMARVYSWMTIGLLLTALAALAVGSNPALVKPSSPPAGSGQFLAAQVVIALGFQAGQPHHSRSRLRGPLPALLRPDGLLLVRPALRLHRRIRCHHPLHHRRHVRGHERVRLRHQAAASAVWAVS